MQQQRPSTLKETATIAGPSFLHHMAYSSNYFFLMSLAGRLGGSAMASLTFISPFRITAERLAGIFTTSIGVYMSHAHGENDIHKMFSVFVSGLAVALVYSFALIALYQCCFSSALRLLSVQASIHHNLLVFMNAQIYTTPLTAISSALDKLLVINHFREANLIMNLIEEGAFFLALNGLMLFAGYNLFLSYALAMITKKMLTIGMKLSFIYFDHSLIDKLTPSLNYFNWIICKQVLHHAIPRIYECLASRFLEIVEVGVLSSMGESMLTISGLLSQVLVYPWMMLDSLGQASIIMLSDTKKKDADTVKTIRQTHLKYAMGLSAGMIFTLGLFPQVALRAMTHASASMIANVAPLIRIAALMYVLDGIGTIYKSNLYAQNDTKTPSRVSIATKFFFSTLPAATLSVLKIPSFALLSTLDVMRYGIKAGLYRNKVLDNEALQEAQIKHAN